MRFLLVLQLILCVAGVVTSTNAFIQAGQREDALQAATRDRDQCRERLTEVDCSAPLNPRLPFGGMGPWRATYCPGSQP